MYKIIVGEIAEKRRENWFCADENPYGVWDGKALVETNCYIGTWTVADGLLRDRVDVDWGSNAWKGEKAELIRFFEAAGLNGLLLDALTPEKDYAVVFLETVWGDSA